MNALFVGANTIYEVSSSMQSTLRLEWTSISLLTYLLHGFTPPLIQTEINTHLNVLHINLNTNYDTATSTDGALDTMLSIFASAAGWHYTSPEGIKPDLHHALLSKNLGGGIAYLGQICSSSYGFGLSANLSGNYVSMDNAVVWDMMVVSKM